MNAVARERLVRLDAAADSATSTNLLATVEDLHPTYSMRTSMAVASMWWLAAPPHSVRVQRVSLIPNTRYPGIIYQRVCFFTSPRCHTRRNTT